MAFNRNGNIDTGLDIENSIEPSNLMQFPLNWKRAKGQLISKGLFDVFNSSKKPTKTS